MGEHWPVQSSAITNNSASSDGGGIFTHYGITATVADSTIIGNTAGSQGGGFITDNGNLTVTCSTVSGNLRNGEVVSMPVSRCSGDPVGEGVILVNDSDITDNTSHYGGGGISSYNCNLSVNGSTISGNSASSASGGLQSTSRQFNRQRQHDQQ